MKKIRAGRTQAFCGETVRITGVADDDPDEQWIVGLTGRITHPFPGYEKYGIPAEEYIAGVYLDPHTRQYPLPPALETNLMVGDTFEVIDPSTAEEYPDWV